MFVLVLLDTILLMAKEKTLKEGIAPVGFLSEVSEEMRHVTWSTRKEAFNKTAIVIGISLITSLYLSGLDYAFTAISKYLYN